MLLIDEHEPANIEDLLKKSGPTVRSPLNRMSMADYFFGTFVGERSQFNRVQAGELLGDVDSMEDELRRYFPSAGNNYQIIEGVISPCPLATLTDKQVYAVKGGKLLWSGLGHEPAIKSPMQPSTRVRNQHAKTYTYRVENITDAEGVTFSILTDGRAFRQPISMIYVWIHRLDRAGITTYRTLNWTETARLLSTVYRNEQKAPEEHSTLTRVIKPKIHIKEAEPFMKAIMFLSSAYNLQIGEARAKVLFDNFANLLDLAMADVDEVASCEGMGKTTAKKLLTAFGRTLQA